jgi:hypothetical protein
MAQFLKVGAGAAGTGVTETLIPIANIGAITSIVNAANVTTITIQMANFQTVGTYVITVPGVTGAASQNTTSAMREKDASDALNAALTANPGGVVSTLNAVPALFQVPAAQGPGGSDGKGPGGRTVVTTAATFAQYTTCTYTA